MFGDIVEQHFQAATLNLIRYEGTVSSIHLREFNSDRDGVCHGQKIIEKHSSSEAGRYLVEVCGNPPRRDSVLVGSLCTTVLLAVDDGAGGTWERIRKNGAVRAGVRRDEKLLESEIWDLQHLIGLSRFLCGGRFSASTKILRCCRSTTTNKIRQPQPYLDVKNRLDWKYCDHD